MLDGVTSTWGVAEVELATARSCSAGLLLGDLLVCMGGYGAVGWSTLFGSGVAACVEHPCCGSVTYMCRAKRVEGMGR